MNHFEPKPKWIYSWHFLGNPVQTTITLVTTLLPRYGEKLEMYCKASGLPEPNIKWAKGNTILPYGK